MPTKRQVLEQLKRNELLAAVKRYELEVGDRRVVAQLVEALASSRRKNYHINIFYSDEDDGYIADVPDLEACSAVGDTPEEALAELERAKAAWLKVARDEGKPVPPPR